MVDKRKRRKRRFKKRRDENREIFRKSEKRGDNYVTFISFFSFFNNLTLQIML